jgi:PAS domain S-box-containing protein
MNWQQILYVASLFVASVIMVILAIYAWRRRPATGAAAFAWAMLLAAWLALTAAFSFISRTSEAEIVWFNLGFISFGGMPVAWCIFALQLTYPQKRVKPFYIFLMAAIPLITQAMVWTNHLHGWFFRTSQLFAEGIGIITKTGSSIFGPWFWIHTAYSYIGILVAVVLLLRAAVQMFSIYRSRAIALVAGTMAPVAASMLDTFATEVLGDANVTAFSFMLCGLAWIWVLPRYRLFDVVPVARDRVINSMSDGMLVLDTQNRIVDLNPALSRLFGVSAGQVIGQPVDEVLSCSNDSPDSNASADDWRAISGFLRDKAVESNNKFPWGNKTLSVTAAPVHLGSGEEIGTVAVFHDFTREAEIDRMKSAFVSIASHDLRTPLGAILGYAGMLRHGRRGPLSPDQAEIVDGIVSAAEEMRALANNLLDKAQIEVGSITLYASPFSPADLVEGVRDVMFPLVEAKGLALVTQVEEDVPATISGDRQRLHQILINLLSNAVKFTSQGSITLRAYRQDEVHWVLAVSDTGQGILEEEQVHMFEPFRRGEDSASQYQGAGLGLYIVKQLIGLMDGEIHLESEVGKGSTFTLVLPLDLPRDN